SAVFYVGSTLVCSLLGKIVVTRFFFDYPIVILMLQMATTLFIIELLRVIGVLKLSPYSFDKGRHFFLPSILLCIAQWLTLSAFEGIGMPAFDSVKRVTPVIIFCASSAISRQSRLNNAQLVGVIGVSLGSLLTVNLELSLDRYSLFYGLTAATLQAVAYMQFEILSRTYQAVELLYVNSFNSLIFFLLVDVVQDEIRDAFMFMLTSAHPWFGGVFAVLLLSGILIQFVTFLCLEHNGALRTQILSNIRAAVQIFIAYFLSLYLFYDVSPSFLNYISLICTIGAAYYLYKQRSADCMPQKSPLTNKV
ncbi:hypothetical protein Angca_004779, partial [Angiostrongylus cantonensis]